MRVYSGRRVWLFLMQVVPTIMAMVFNYVIGSHESIRGCLLYRLVVNHEG